MIFPSSNLWPLYDPMSGGSPNRWRAGVPTPSLAPHPSDPLHRDPVHPPDGSGAQLLSTTTSHQRTITDHVLDSPDKFDDTPYVPPRITQAELQSYPALDPRLGSVVYDHDPHQYPHEGGTSPAESHQSTESSWSASSSSSASSHQLPRDYLVDPTSHYSQNPLPTTRHPHPQHYPAYYHSHHRLGIEHVRYGERPSDAGGSYYRAPPQAYPADGLLSPEMFDDVATQVNISSQMNYPPTSSQESSSSSAVPTTSHPSNVSTFSMSSTPLTDDSRSHFPDAGPYLRQQLGLSAHESISLQSLPDPAPGEKPSTPLPMLIKLAIYGSPNKQLTLQEIYTELENRFQWFQDHKREKAWKNSIRHNLSLNKVFRHVPRPITEPGKGSYWQLDVSGGEGYKRPRKRRPKSRMITSEEEDEEASELDDDRPSPSDPTGLNRSSTTPVEDTNIDPGLRTEGHVVGEGRTRSTTRRAGGSPYPSQSPRYQQGSLPLVAGQDATGQGQPPVRFGQPSFGQSSFPPYSQTRPLPVASTTASFAALSSPSAAVAPATTMVTIPQLRQVASYDGAVHIPQPLPPLRSGIEYVMDPGSLLATQPVETYLAAQVRPLEDVAHSSPESSSGSSRTWNDSRSGPEMQG